MPTVPIGPIDWNRLLDSFAHRKILVVGDVMLDDYRWGDVDRICPEAPVPLFETRSQSERPGGAANAAANLAALGAKPFLIGVVGRDHQADQLRVALREAGVDPGGLLASEDRPTTAKTRLMARERQVIRIDSEQKHPIPRPLADSLVRQVERLIPDVEAVLLCDYAKGVFSAETIARLIQCARQRNLPVVVDPKGKDFLRYRGATLIKPNMHELNQVGRRPIQSTADMHMATQHLLSELEGTAILVTQGSEGMTLFRPDAEPWHQPAAIPRAVFDVTGAGDTVVSVLALALVCRASLTQSIQLANLAASIVVSKLGTSVVSAEELRLALTSDTK